MLKLACLSLVTTSSMGFTTSAVTMPLHLTGAPLAVEAQRILSPSQLSMVVSSSSSSSAAATLPRLTGEEETELLRQAMELRRLTQLEQELALQSLTKDQPMLSIRSKAAGYGDDLEAYEDAKYDGQKARDLLVTRNMGLVHYCVNQILGKQQQNKRLNSLSKDDLVQEGAIGLARAIDKWNPAIGGKFSTYAVYWVRAAALRCIAERDDMLRVPSHVTQTINQINKASKHLGIELDGFTGPNANWKQAQAAKQLAEEVGCSDRNFEEAMKVRSRRYTGGYVAFESWMQKGENLQSDVPTMQPDVSSLETEHLRTTLSKFLRPKEMEALSWRYGLLDDDKVLAEETKQERANRYFVEAEEELFGTTVVQAKAMKASKKLEIPSKGRFGEAMTFNEVGKKMQVSAEYGRRLCHAALAKLRSAAEDGRLEPALLY